jgi:hypothetical protein
LAPYASSSSGPSTPRAASPESSARNLHPGRRCQPISKFHARGKSAYPRPATYDMPLSPTASPCARAGLSDSSRIHRHLLVCDLWWLGVGDGARQHFTRLRRSPVALVGAGPGLSFSTVTPGPAPVRGHLAILDRGYAPSRGLHERTMGFTRAPLGRPAPPEPGSGRASSQSPKRFPSRFF